MHPRLYRLIEAHQRIDRELRDELQRPRPDGLRALMLKKLKLRAKEAIHRFMRRPASA